MSEQRSELALAADAMDAVAKLLRALDERQVVVGESLAPQEIARRLSVDPSTVYRLIQKRELLAVQVAEGTLRVELSEFQRFLKSRRMRVSLRSEVA